MVDEEKTTNQNDKELVFSLKYSSCSDVGMRREENQDSYAIFQAGSDRLFVVADGMGGVKGGAIASSLAIKTLAKEFKNFENFEIGKVSAVVVGANNVIYNRGIEMPEYAGMGTTIVGLCFKGDQLLVINVGDSRAYRIRNSEVKQLTYDHTLVSELLRTGAITEDQVKDHPISHMLTRSLGPIPIVEVDCMEFEEKPKIGDRYIICSDGLYNMVSSEEMESVSAKSSIENVASQLVATANQNGGVDNISCIVIEVEGIKETSEEETASAKPIFGGAVVNYSEARFNHPYGETEEKNTKELMNEGATQNGENFAINNTRDSKLDLLKYIGSFMVLMLAFFVGRYGFLYAKDKGLNEVREATDSSNIFDKGGYQGISDSFSFEQTKNSLNDNNEKDNKYSIESVFREFSESEGGVDFIQYDKVEYTRVKNLLEKFTNMIDELSYDNVIDYSKELKKEKEELLDLQNKQKQLGQKKELLENRNMVWVTRSKRYYNNKNTLKMVKEIAPFVKEVDVVYKEISAISRKIQEEMENAHYHPNDRAKQEDVISSMLEYDNKLSEADNIVVNALKNEQQKSSEELAEITIEKKNLRQSISEKKIDIEFYKAMLENNEEAKTRVKKNLESQIQRLQSEIKKFSILEDSK